MSVNKKNSDGSYNQYASKPYVTKDNIGLSKVENKSSEDIRGEITSKNVTDALGYTPVNPNPQFIYDTEAKMTKTVPDGVNKGIVSMIGGKTQKCKNILKLPKLTEQTENGVTFTPVYDEDDNLLYINANGTPNAGKNATYVILSGSDLQNFSNYVFSVNQTQKTSNTLYGAIELSAYPYTSYARALNDEDATIKNYDPSSRILIFVRVADTGTADNIRFYPMIRKVNSPAGYEPYHEDLWNASVEKVVLNSTNLFDKTLVHDSYAKVTQLPDGISLTGSYYALFYFDCKPNTNYTISYTADGDNQVEIYDESISDAGKIALWTGLTGGTFNSGSHKRIVVLLYASRGSNTKTSNYYNICLVEGTTAPTAYTPYRKTTFSLERIVDKLPDYGCSAGDVYNYVDFEEMVYHHKIGSLDLSTVIWETTVDTNGRTRFRSVNSFENMKSAKQDEVANMITGKYRTVSNNIAYAGIEDKIINNIAENHKLYITDLSCPTINVLVHTLKNQLLVYELETEELIPLADLLLPFKCEPGGTITFENDHNLDVPNTVIYEKEMK